ncbi:nitrate assimilation regulatory protein [Colletotrichum musicola]|uniref:Nitrate assimilation regulatory protein n=1 Tax=Colletotrichum musicola TaxID=2175873 RepID=A0A8H6IV91_9PEZI|nr:nitrate assimilation regulatory protein [Colletotrichum musicola]
MSATAPNQACFVCRFRKIRCDGTSPRCKACGQLGVQCPGYDATSGNISRKELRPLVESVYRAAGLERRESGSCRACARSKSRCSKSLPACARCVSRDVECVYSSGVAVYSRFQPERERTSQGDAQGEVEARHRQASNPDWNSLSPGNGSHTWLSDASELPKDSSHLHTLVEAYFARIHPLRCLGFLYKPAWINSARRGSLVQDHGEALVLVVCAFGARCISLASNRPRGPATLPGSQWANWALDLVLADVRKPTRSNLMAILLLCQYFLYSGSHATAFQLVGMSERLVRLLRLDVSGDDTLDQQSGDVAVEKEANVRMVWSSYALDSIMASGVAENTCWHQLPRVALPIADNDFIAQACPRSTHLYPAQTLLLDGTSSVRDMSPRAHFVYIAHLRKRCLTRLIDELDLWHASLPPHLVMSFSPVSVYALKDMYLLSATLALHASYHVAVVGLTRIFLPGFAFPLSMACKDVPPEFTKQCRRRCRYHADEITKLVDQAFQHAPEVFDDLICHMAAFEASKVQIIHTAFFENTENSRAELMSMLETNMHLMDVTALDSKLLHRRTLFDFLRHLHLGDIARDLDEKLGINLASTSDTALNIDPIEPPPAFYLSTIAPFRTALSEVQAVKSQTATPAEPSNQEHSTRIIPPPISTIAPGSPKQTVGEGIAVSHQELAASSGGGLTPFGVPNYDDDLTELLMWDCIELDSWPDPGTFQGT